MARADGPGPCVQRDVFSRWDPILPERPLARLWRAGQAGGRAHGRAIAEDAEGYQGRRSDAALALLHCLVSGQQASVRGWRA